jgi:hypothetical protein
MVTINEFWTNDWGQLADDTLSYGEDFAGLVTVTVTAHGAALARLLGVQHRVLARRLDKNPTITLDHLGMITQGASRYKDSIHGEILRRSRRELEDVTDVPFHVEIVEEAEYQPPDVFSAIRVGPEAIQITYDVNVYAEPED